MGGVTVSLLASCWQAAAVARTLDGRTAKGKVLDASFGPRANDALDKTRGIHIVACGTSYHAGLVARYWIEELCRISVALVSTSPEREDTILVRDPFAD